MLSTGFGDLGVAVQILVILGPALFLLAMIFSIKAREFSWPNIAVFGISMSVLLLPSIQKLSIGKDAVSFELFQRSVEPARDALAALQKANEENSRALAALQDSITEIKTQYALLLSQQNNAIASLANRGGAGQPPGAVLPDVNALQRELTRIQGGLTTKLDLAQKSIESAAPNNEMARSKIRDIDSALRMAK